MVMFNAMQANPLHGMDNEREGSEAEDLYVAARLLPVNAWAEKKYEFILDVTVPTMRLTAGSMRRWFTNH